MSIKSNAFGRVTLTDEDAKKFKRQVTYGRPSAAAVESVKRGIEHSKELQKSGRVSFTIKARA
jgi:hypothetical protein